MTDHGQESTVPGALLLRLSIAGVLLLALIGLALAWSWSPLRQWLDVALIVGKLEDYGRAFGPIAATLGFAAALVVAVPLTFLTLVALVAFGPVTGFFISLAAAALGAAVTFLLGKILGHDIVRRIGGARLNLVSERLSKRGVLAVIAVRMVPVAPFAIVNMFAGASHLRLRDMIVGTVIGMTPGALLMMFFVNQIVDALKHPGLTTVAVAVVLIFLVVGGVLALRKWLTRERL